MSGIIHPYYTVALAPADRRPGRHRRQRAVANPAHLARARRAGRGARGHGGRGLGPAGPQSQLVPLAAGGHRRCRRRRRRPDPGRPIGPARHRAGPGRACRCRRVARGGRRAGRTARLQPRHRRHRAQRIDTVGRPHRGQLVRRPRRRLVPRRRQAPEWRQAAEWRHVPGPYRRFGRAGFRRVPRSLGREGLPGSGELSGGTDRSPSGRAGFPSGGTAGGPGGATTSAALSKLLETGASGYKWAAATVSSTSAASLELNSNGVPVMAIGGFTGSDPAPSLAEFKKLVAEHEIHYFIGGGSAEVAASAVQVPATRRRSPRGSSPTSRRRPWAAPPSTT